MAGAHGWDRPLFGPMQLAPEDEAAYEELATHLLDQTLREFDDYEDSRGAMDARRWKLFKTQPNFTMYYERGSGHESSAARIDSRVVGNAAYARPTVVVGAGTIDAPMDDVLYGDTALDVRDMRLKAALVNGHLTEGAVLAQITGPTADEPFRFLGLKWVVGEALPALRRFVKPRDFVYLASTGTLTRENGDYIGYELIQSVDLTEQYPTLEAEHGITRGKTAAGVILKQRLDGSTDLFVRSYVERNGRVMNAILLTHTWTTYMGFFSTPACSFAKKLAWCVDSIESVVKRRHLQYAQRDVTATNCGRCLRVLNRGHEAVLHARNSCVRCGSPLCSSCRELRPVKWVDMDMKLHALSLVVCRPCVAFATQLNAAEIARREILAGRYGLGPMADATLQSRFLLDRVTMGTSMSSISSGVDLSILELGTS